MLSKPTLIHILLLILCFTVPFTLTLVILERLHS